MGITIYGMWGILNDVLVHPSIPNSEPIILFCENRCCCAYIISEDKIVNYPDILVGPVAGSGRFDIDPQHRIAINTYLDGENVKIWDGNLTTQFSYVGRTLSQMYANDLVR